MKKFYMIVSIVIVLFIMVNAGSGNIIFLEGEKFKKQSGGEVKVQDSRPGSSQNKCLSNWDDKGHTLFFEFKTAKPGKYQVIIRYCQNREYSVFRDIKIDNKYPNEAFKKLVMAPTGGWSKTADDWVNYQVLGADGNPLIIEIGKGKHTLSSENTGCEVEGAKGSVNLDYIALVPEGESIDSLKTK